MDTALRSSCRRQPRAIHVRCCAENGADAAVLQSVDQSVLQRCRLSRQNNVGQLDQPCKHTQHVQTASRPAKSSGLGAAVFAGFCKYCVSSCSLDVLHTILEFSKPLLIFLHVIDSIRAACQGAISSPALCRHQLIYVLIVGGSVR